MQRVSTNTSLQPAKRRFRWQVSLRMLLILMALVGVSLAIYRWPWEETKQHQIGTEIFQGDIADYVTRSTYHRNWRGAPVLHGPKLIQRNKQVRIESNYYDGELHGPRRVNDHRGRMLWEAHYRNGHLHGPFRAGNGEHWYWSGHYWNDQPHGQWEFITYRPTPQVARPPQGSDLRKSYLFFAENAAIIARRKDKDEDRLFLREKQSWHRGQRHGVWKWESLAGELVNAAEYDDDNFVSWNGAPVVKQFWEWLKTAPLHADAKSLLYASENIAAKQESVTSHQVCFRLADKNEDALPLVVFTEPSKGIRLHLPQGERALVPMLCELACTNGYAFDCRYGTLWLVPNVDPAPAFVDPTGVMQIRFPEGSPQARDWLAEVEVHESFEEDSVLVKKLLAGSSIVAVEGRTIDREPLTPRISDQLRQSYRQQLLLNRYYAMGRNPSMRLLHRISRRDALGLLLHRTGGRCEQQGDGRIVLIDNQPREYPQDPFASPFE